MRENLTLTLIDVNAIHITLCNFSTGTNQQWSELILMLVKNEILLKWWIEWVKQILNWSKWIFACAEVDEFHETSLESGFHWRVISPRSLAVSIVRDPLLRRMEAKSATKINHASPAVDPDMTANPRIQMADKRISTLFIYKN